MDNGKLQEWIFVHALKSIYLFENTFMANFFSWKCYIERDIRKTRGRKISYKKKKHLLWQHRFSLISV